MDNQPYKY